MSRRRIMLATGILLVATLTAAISLLQHTHSAKPHPTVSTPKNVVTKTVTNPSTVQPTAKTYTSSAGPDEPSYISLPTIDSGGYIENVGIDQYNQMAAPDNVHLAGWYVNSLSPGQAGLSIIDGHVDGYYHNQGIFGKLNKLKVGDTFTVTFGNGSKKSFRVQSLQLVTADNVPSVLFAHNASITSQLDLITCGGDYDGVSHTYDSRTIVVSSLIS